ncbi:MAG: hypothetical protein K9L19_18220 [Desulfarculaceae bacterium]|nr:hypothetical protein [Desulfarculaceae bacterium]
MTHSYDSRRRSQGRIDWHPLAIEAFEQKLTLKRVARLAGIPREEAMEYFMCKEPIPPETEERIELAIKILADDTPSEEKMQCWDTLAPGLVQFLTAGR